MRTTLSIAFGAIVSLSGLCSCTGQIGGVGPSVGNDDRGAGGGGGNDQEATGGSGGMADGAGGTPAQGTASIASASRFARLTHFQFRNAARDLLRLPSLPPTMPSLQADAVLGFDNNNTGKALDVSLELRSDYERAAEALAAHVAADPQALARLMPSAGPTDLEGKARSVIASLASRAYRRPLAAGEADELWSLFDAGSKLGTSRDPFAAGMEALISALLQSPFFVYRTELGEGNNTEGFALTAHELASRLAFALTDTMPDDELMSAAGSGKLRTATELRTQAQRLLSKEAALTSAQHFHEQLFRLAAYDKVNKDTKVFPNFSASFVVSLKEEASRFFNELVASAQDPSALLTSTTTFVDKALANVYGVQPPTQDGFMKANLNPQERRGLLTQAGFLASNAGAVDPDPIHRGVFISEVLLCKTLPPPAMNVPPIPANVSVTNRQRVEAHTGKGTCGAACHATLINPLGYAFEGYDAIGRYRTKDNGAPVDSSGSYAELAEGNVTFANGLELSDTMAHSRDFHACYLGNWAAYLWSRTQRDDDREPLDEIVTASMKGASIRDSLLAMVLHPSFARFVP